MSFKYVVEDGIPVVTLNNGVKIPGIGKGCWLGPEGGLNVAEDMVKNALKVGYRHLDTAAGYMNEELVGKAIRESGIPREEIFVTTKLRPKHHHRVREAFEDSLAALGLKYIDLYLMHWPPTEAPDGKVMKVTDHPNYIDVWQEMEKLLDTGKVRAIGVSNFSVKTLGPLLEKAKIVPATNQVEVHPCHPQFKLEQYCKERGILISAYSPLGQGNPLFFEDSDFKSVVEAHQGATPAQVVMSWLVQREILPIAKSQNVERMKGNKTLVELTKDEIELINEIHKKPGMHRSLMQYHKPEGTVFGWTYEELGWEGMKVGGLIS